MDILFYVLVAIAVLGVAYWAIFYAALGTARISQWAFRRTGLNRVDWKSVSRAVFGHLPNG